MLDVSPNIKGVVEIKDLNFIKERKMVSLHDFDLNFFLNLMKKLGKVKNITIIVIPLKGDEEIIAEDVLKFL